MTRTEWTAERPRACDWFGGQYGGDRMRRRRARPAALPGWQDRRHRAAPSKQVRCPEVSPGAPMPVMTEQLPLASCPGGASGARGTRTEPSPDGRGPRTRPVALAPWSAAVAAESSKSSASAQQRAFGCRPPDEGDEDPPALRRSGLQNPDWTADRCPGRTVFQIPSTRSVSEIPSALSHGAPPNSCRP
jgi:hypothetical protein